MEHSLYVKDVTWSDVRSDFQKAEPELTKIIDELSPGKNFPLVKVKYPFGSFILDNSIVHFPTHGYESLPLSHHFIPNKIKEILGYSNLPLGCVVNNHGAEVYRETKDHLHSIAFFNNGLNLGIVEFFGTLTPFSISAGARSMLMLPKIADSRAHIALRHYGVKSPPPASAFDHWQIFREIANHKNFANPWYCEVVYFTKQWIDKINNDPSWFKFKYFILQRAWQHTEYSRNRFLHDEMWESFFNILSVRRIKPISYVVDLFKHIILIAIGFRSFTAYKPTNGKELAGPTDELQRIYLENYNKMKNHIPTVMIPVNFRIDDTSKFVYSSLQLPTYWNSVPKSRDSVSAKRDLDYFIWLIDTFQRELVNGHVITHLAKAKELFNDVSFDFFHSDGDINDRIKPASILPNDDKDLLYMPGKPNQYGKREFATHCSFMRGCIRISLKNL